MFAMRLQISKELLLFVGVSFALVNKFTTASQRCLALCVPNPLGSGTSYDVVGKNVQPTSFSFWKQNLPSQAKKIHTILSFTRKDIRHRRSIQTVFRKRREALTHLNQLSSSSLNDLVAKEQTTTIDDDNTRILLEETLKLLNVTDPLNLQLCSEMLNQVDEEYYEESMSTKFMVEPLIDSAATTTSTNEAILSQVSPLDEFFNPINGHRMLIRSGRQPSQDGSTSLKPIFNTSSIAIIREAAEALWRRQQASNCSSGKSRFTYQRPGNSEAHVYDLFDINPKVKDIVNEALVGRLYPILRRSFGNNTTIRDPHFSNRGHDVYPLSPSNLPLDQYRLAVYDALIIRYDAEEAKKHQLAGAGQPLHRDLGLCSINIALSPLNEFEGGGTFFENLLHLDLERLGRSVPNGIDVFSMNRDSSKTATIKPLGAGEFVAHPCSERHAGCMATGGVRDIMVLFITAQQQNAADDSHVAVEKRTPTAERVGRIRNMARAATTTIQKRLFNVMAVKEAPHDGDAWSNLGASLLMDDGESNVKERRILAEHALKCITHATTLLPYDSRIRNNLGLALSKIKETQEGFIHHHNEFKSFAGRNHSPKDLDKRIEEAFMAAVQLDSICDRAGCDVSSDRAVSLLNLGLLYANRDDFEKAVDVLSRIKEPVTKAMDDPTRMTVFENGFRLLRFCQSQLSKEVAHG